MITPAAMRQLIQFIYTGTIERELCDLNELKQAAEFLNIPELFKNFKAISKAKGQDMEIQTAVGEMRNWF